VRILLDTNIIVSGLLSPNGPPGRLLLAWLDDDFQLVTSRHQLVELHRVLGYDRLKHLVRPEQVRDFVLNIDAKALVVADGFEVTNLSPDPDDNMILAAAITGNADLIVSGDKPHMLGLKSAAGIPIITAREALGRLTEPST
jgi:putative PIN family toxin of toxin-antitoxin system